MSCPSPEALNSTYDICVRIRIRFRVFLTEYWGYSLGSGMVQIGSAVGYADSERTVEQSSLDGGSSGRCGG